MEHYSAPKKEWCTGTCHQRDEPWKHYAQWNKPDIKEQNIVWYHLYEGPIIGNFIGRKVKYRG